MSTALIIIVIVLVLLILTGIGVAVGRAALARQRRIWQMKRFRRETRGHRVQFDDEDKKTIAV
jgi:MFS superfamily sulfate permease-like transporter